MSRVCSIILLMFFVICHSHPSGAAGAEVHDFFNVISPSGADPWVIKHKDGHYYMTVTTGHDVTIWRANTIAGFIGAERKVVWTPPRSSPNSKNIWAPELHRLEGKWYIYYAADNGKHQNHRLYVLENSAEDPFKGRFVEKGKICDHKNDRYAIDGTVLNLKGKMFLIWSGRPGDQHTTQNIYIAPMRNPWTLGGPRAEISKPEYSWENHGNPHVNEGPEVLVHRKTINIVYSASGSWTNHYCLGLLTAKIDSDLLAQASWKKHDKPVFQSGNGVISPGHCSFVKSPDGEEDWIVYHAARYPGARWTRNIRTQNFGWHKGGTPRFGGPCSPDAPIQLPGGEPVHQRYEAEDADLAGTAKSVPCDGASHGAKVGYIDTPESHVEFRTEIHEEGRYNLSIRFGNGTAKKEVASHKLSVNGKPVSDVKYPNSGWNNWFNAGAQVELKSGVNTIRFSKGQGFAEIDCIDLFPVSENEP